jgi:carbon monoxide dehydrogenase subunit G
MRVERTIHLPCPAQEAWARLVDWERQAEWMLDADRVRVVSARREGLGVRLAVRTRLFGVPAFTEPMEVIGWDPPRSLTIRHGGPVSGTGTWTLAPQPGGTVFSWTEDVALRVPVLGNLAARAYAPAMRFLMGRAMLGLRRSVIAAGPAREDARD